MLKMTNLRPRADHNICGCGVESVFGAQLVDVVRERRSEGGYTLVALLAFMTVLALFAMAAAPSMQQQAQREREKEAIFRGEQVADAIREYYLNRTRALGIQGEQALPSSMDQLLEGIPIQGGAKKRQILRVSASRDPLSAEGEWRYVKPRSQALLDFQRSILLYTGNLIPRPKDPQIVNLQQFAAPQIVSAIDTGTDTTSKSSSSIDDDSSGPFVGVSPRNSNSAVLAYYGIEELNQWIFTPLFRP